MLADTGYRYQVLLKAIDFFTQRFSMEQIGKYAFEFANEILTLNASALFIKEEKEYVLKNIRLYDLKHYSIASTKELDQIPVLHGDIISKQFELYFSEAVTHTFNIKLLIPLIVGDSLYGFILSDGKILSEFNEGDYIIASTLVKLFANSLENSRQLQELALKNKQLDQKIFNLFATNQSAKSLLAEVDLENLYVLATDIFSEITCSKITSFGIYDSLSNSVKVLGYRNILSYSTVFTEIQLSSRIYNDRKIVLDFSKDIELIKSIFVNWEEFSLLHTKYIILLVKDTILGVVTLSEAVNDRIYDEETFELIETLASFTYIAISNALLFKELEVQRQRIQKKFDVLNKLNAIIQTINEGASIDELFELTLKVLSLNFGVEKAFFAFHQEEGYILKKALNMETTALNIVMNEEWKKAYGGDRIVDFRQDGLKHYFLETEMHQIGKSNCIMIAPLCVSSSYYGDQKTPKGFLVVLETKDSLKEEEILLIDTIAKNISPVIFQMDLNRQMKEEYKVDQAKALIREVKLKLSEREEYDLEFYIYYKIVNKSLFEEVDESFSDEVGYCIDNILFILSYDDKIDDNSFCIMPRIEKIEEILKFDYFSYYYQHKNNLINL